MNILVSGFEYIGSFFLGMALTAMVLFLIRDEAQHEHYFKIAVLAALMAIVFYLLALIG